MNKFIMHTLIIYTLTTCPYCIRAKALLDKKNIIYQEIEVSKYTKEQREELRKKANDQKTVPQIFINGKHIGGCDNLYQLEEKGELDKLLKS